MKDIISILPAPEMHWVGDGFPVKTLFSYSQHSKLVSPFLLLDYAGPMDFTPSEQSRGVGQHPHRGFETVTLVYEGELAHKDSTGEQGEIGPGDVQWMTAGGGILHEEFHSPAFSRHGGRLEMIQLWVNLPASHKMSRPGYQAITANDIPHITLPNNSGKLRLIAGSHNEQTGPARTHSPMLVMDGSIKAGGHCLLPLADGWNAIVVVRSGCLQVNGRQLMPAQTLICSKHGSGLELNAAQDSEFIVLSGEPIDEPIAGYGPFVMNTDAEIRQALQDFKTGKFAQ